jgi:hypothetical protein
MTQQPFNLCDPSVDINPEKKRLVGQCAAIMERLKRGPATNRELAAISLKYTSRVSDLRNSGFKIEVSRRDHATGLTEYTLKEQAE